MNLLMQDEKLLLIITKVLYSILNLSKTVYFSILVTIIFKNL